MRYKTFFSACVLSAAMFAPCSAPSLHGGIMDLVTTTLGRKVPAQPPALKILVVHDVPGTIIEVKGKYKIYDPRNNDQISKSFQGKRRFIQALADGLRWGEEFPGVHQIVIMPNDPKTTTIVDGIEFQGPIYVYDIGGSISVVNKVNVEDYLAAILTQRYPNSLPEELLAAIAIAERTKCYHRIQNSKSDFWNVEAKREGYQGYVMSKNPAIEAAISKTKYMALQQPGEGPFALDWLPTQTKSRIKGVTYSKISVDEAEKMAEKGKNGAEILKAAYPTASLQLSFSQSK